MAPMTEPINKPTMTHSKDRQHSNITETMAISIPDAETRLPVRARSGRPNILMPIMKRIEATMYPRSMNVWL